MATLVMNSISTSVYGVTGGISVNAVEKSQHRSVQEIDINSGNDIISEECNINDKKIIVFQMNLQNIPSLSAEMYQY